MKQVLAFSISILMIIVLTACNPTKNATIPISGEVMSGIPGPKAIIYKTRHDYSNLVPVILSENRKTIVSYPDVKDVFYKGLLAYPTQLKGGFLLDNRGINQYVAFINITFDSYSKLKKTPSADALMKMIVDKNPLKSMYSCGLKPAYQNIEQELNEKIEAGDFSSFVKLK